MDATIDARFSGAVGSFALDVAIKAPMQGVSINSA